MIISLRISKLCETLPDVLNLTGNGKNCLGFLWTKNSRCTHCKLKQNFTHTSHDTHQTTLMSCTFAAYVIWCGTGATQRCPVPDPELQPILSWQHQVVFFCSCRAVLTSAIKLSRTLQLLQTAEQLNKQLNNSTASTANKKRTEKESEDLFNLHTFPKGAKCYT